MSADERYKGHDELLDIWPALLARKPDARLVVAGDGDRSPAARVARRIAGRVARRDVRRPRRRRELAALYGQCRFLVMPSRDEGFGLVFLEAMRAGKACVGATAPPKKSSPRRDRPDRATRTSRTHLATAVFTLFDDRACALRRRRAGAVSVDLHRCRFQARFARALERRRSRAERVMNILGLNAYHGDVSAVARARRPAVAAVEEERFRRDQALRRISRHAHRRVSAHGRARRPRRRRVRRLAQSPRAPVAQGAVSPAHRPRRTSAIGCAMSPASGGCPAPIAASLGLDEYDVRPRMRYVEHHPAHLASAAFVSPFDDAAVCAIDGFGDFVSTSWGRLEGSAVARRPPRVLPAFARPAVSRHHAVSRLSQLRRRVQGDGPRAVRRAALRQGDRSLVNLRDGGDVRARPLVLQPLVRRRHDDVGRRRADDRPGVHAEARGAARAGAPAGRAAPAQARGDRRVAAGGLREARVARARGTSTRRRRTRGCASRAAAR